MPHVIRHLLIDDIVYQTLLLTASNRREINVSFFFQLMKFKGLVYKRTYTQFSVSSFSISKKNQRYNFPFLLILLRIRRSCNFHSYIFFFSFYLDEMKILPALSTSDRITVGQPQDGFSRSENGSRAVFPTVRNRGFIVHCHRAFAVNVRGILPRGAHSTGRDWSVACLFQTYRSARRTCISLRQRRWTPVMQFATDVTSDTPWNIVAATINSTMFAPSGIVWKRLAVTIFHWREILFIKIRKRREDV